MRLLRFFAIFVLFVALDYVGNIHICFTPSLHPFPSSSGVSNGLYESKDVSTSKKTVFIDLVVFHLLIFILWLIFLQYQSWVYICSNTDYVPFDTNLNLFKKKKNSIFPWYSCLWYSSTNFIALILLSEYETKNLPFFLAIMSKNSDFLLWFELTFQLLFKFKKTITMMFLVTSVILIFSIATNPSDQYVCVCVLQIFCFSFVRKLPPWLSIILILISNDIEQNPGPGYHSNFFNFMNWNPNSLATNDFARVQLIEAHNSLHNYDLISICETSLTDSMVPNVPEFDGYQPITLTMLLMVEWAFSTKIHSQLL